MARIVVAAPDSVTGRGAAERLLQRLRDDGHEAERLGSDLITETGEADGTVCILDGGAFAGTAHAAAACAAAQDRPVLALVGTDAPRRLDHDRITYHPGVEEADWWVALDDWYDQVRPFAGRVVRDLIPQLVREAGHDVRFRAATADERPHYLKQKVLAEAKELVAAGAGAEKEEVADLLEALEAFIRARSYDRESLKRVKQAKHKQRGGFERCWVVEATSGPSTDSNPPDDDDGPGEDAVRMPEQDDPPRRRPEVYEV